jgi:hypothetical protein
MGRSGDPNFFEISIFTERTLTKKDFSHSVKTSESFDSNIMELSGLE